MVVEITNITDAPGKVPTQVDIYNKTVDPGGTLKIPADLIDKKVRKLEEAGLIAIGRVPSWYKNAKSKKGRALSPEERQRRIASTPAPVATPPVVEAPVAAPVEAPTKYESRRFQSEEKTPSDSAEVPDESTSDRKRKR